MTLFENAWLNRDGIGIELQYIVAKRATTSILIEVNEDITQREVIAGGGTE